MCVNKNIKTFDNFWSFQFIWKGQNEDSQSSVCVLWCTYMLLYEKLVFTSLNTRIEKVESHFFPMNALNQENRSQSKGFFFCTLKTRIPIHHSVTKYNLFNSSPSIIDLRVENTGIGTQFWSISWCFLSHSCSLPHFFYRSWFLLRFLCLWDITAIKSLC